MWMELFKSKYAKTSHTNIFPVNAQTTLEILEWLRSVDFASVRTSTYLFEQETDFSVFDCEALRIELDQRLEANFIDFEVLLVNCAIFDIIAFKCDSYTFSSILK